MDETLIRLCRYWLYRHFMPGEVTPDLPPDMRIVSGDPRRTSYNESNWAEKRINFQCWSREPKYDRKQSLAYQINTN